MLKIMMTGIWISFAGVPGINSAATNITGYCQR
jgi:hypothetical protein